MAKYVLTFSKKGLIKYTSHLDMMRLFRRTFKRAGMDLQYSNGYNPHPRMSMAMPLSLGTTSECEILEVETKESFAPEAIQDKLNTMMPDGIEILTCVDRDDNKKSIAARVYACEYDILIPAENDEVRDKLMTLPKEAVKAESIISLKKQKKTKKLKEIDIKDKIRELSVEPVDDKILLNATFDGGSNSNLAPEVFLTGASRLLGIELPMESIEITRKKIFYKT